MLHIIKGYSPTDVTPGFHFKNDCCPLAKHFFYAKQPFVRNKPRLSEQLNSSCVPEESGAAAVNLICGHPGRLVATEGIERRVGFGLYRMTSFYGRFSLKRGVSGTDINTFYDKRRRPVLHSRTCSVSGEVKCRVSARP